jgi:hypothetical protein
MKGLLKMPKSARKKTKMAKQVKNNGKTRKIDQSKIADYVDYLLRLHKLQGGLLSELRKALS